MVAKVRLRESREYLGKHRCEVPGCGKLASVVRREMDVRSARGFRLVALCSLHRSGVGAGGVAAVSRSKSAAGPGGIDCGPNHSGGYR
jgi:hypothetical protein